MAVQIICDLFRLICLVDRLVEIGKLSNTARAGSDEENLANFFVFYVFSDR